CQRSAVRGQRSEVKKNSEEITPRSFFADGIRVTRLSTDPDWRVDEIGRQACGGWDATLHRADGRLDDDLLVAHAAGELDVVDADADELDDGVSGVVSRPAHGPEDGDNARLPDDRGQVVFHGGADAGVAVKIEFSVGVELDFTSHVSQVAGADA